MAALGIATTALAEAEKMTAIINVYGEDGSHPAQEVISKLQENELVGSGVLASFLSQWEKDHCI